MTDADLLALYERTVAELYRYASRLTGGDEGFRVFADPAGHPFCLCR